MVMESDPIKSYFASPKYIKIVATPFIGFIANQTLEKERGLETPFKNLQAPSSQSHSKSPPTGTFR